jgi:hypothetical protein
VGRLSRADAADLVTVEEGGIDLAALPEEAAAIRKNLEEMAGNCALGRISRAQMLAATGRATLGWPIGAELDKAARENVLAPLLAAENAATMWTGLDISRKRAVIKTLMTVTLHSPGRCAPPVRPGHGRGHLEAARRRVIPLAAGASTSVHGERGHGRRYRSTRRQHARRPDHRSQATAGAERRPATPLAVSGTGGWISRPRGAARSTMRGSRDRRTGRVRSLARIHPRCPGLSPPGPCAQPGRISADGEP